MKKIIVWTGIVAFVAFAIGKFNCSPEIIHSWHTNHVPLYLGFQTVYETNYVNDPAVLAATANKSFNEGALTALQLFNRNPSRFPVIGQYAALAAQLDAAFRACTNAMERETLQRIFNGELSLPTNAAPWIVAPEPGQQFEWRVPNPFSPENCTNTVLEVRDGWVRSNRRGGDGTVSDECHEASDFVAGRRRVK